MSLSVLQKEILLTALAVIAGCYLVIFASNKDDFLSGPSSVIEDIASIKRTPDLAHTYGDKEAPLRIVEFADFSCHFCAELHPTLKRLVDESDGGVVWEYRHLPILSANSRLAAEISECVAKLSTDDNQFWTFAEQIFESQKNLSSSYLHEMAVGLNLSPQSVSDCLDDGQASALVSEDARVANSMGARGTPFSVIIFPDGQTKNVSGALAYEEWLELIN
ncbi:thioredoxin domain-containing protein [Candidatus Kaiserbacteria bacterium]|nr:thioredoxin domain-containing protein [Candidatus Kaiserbacteria bacterium]